MTYTETPPGQQPAPTAGATKVAPASFAQRRLWFLDHFTGGNSAYNLFSALRLRGPLDSEALHRAGIDPRRAAGRIGAARIAALVGHIRDVLTDAIAAGGSSLRDHRQATGELGYFQHSFRVYDREGAPCPTPGCTGTIRRIVQGGRSSFFCPACQR